MAHHLGSKSFRDVIGVPPSTASTSDSVLVLVDLQNEYSEGTLKVDNVESSRAAAARLLEKYRSAANPAKIVHVTHQTPDGAPVFTPGTALANEFDELKPKEGEHTILKQYPGSFTQTDLGEYLEKQGTKKVVLAGYMAHVCVSTTARQAAERGYDVIVVKEAVGDRSIPGVDAETLKEVSLREIDDAFGTVISLDELK